MSAKKSRVSELKWWALFILFYFLISIFFSIYFLIFELRVKVNMISHMTVTAVTNQVTNITVTSYNHMIT